MAKKLASKQVVLVDGPRGGKLRRGGPSPGSGRHASEVKASALLSLRDRLPVLDHIASGVIEASPGERVRALEALAKISGVDGRISPADVRERLKAQVEVIRSRASWTPEELLVALAEVWR